MRGIRIVALVVALSAFSGAAFAAETRYFDRVDFLPRALMKEAETRKLRETGASEADILAYYLRKYFYAVPEWSSERSEYRPGGVRVTGDDTGSRILVEEPVTGFSVILEYDTGGGQRLIRRKLIRHMSEEVDTVEYVYRNGKLAEARSEIFGRVVIPAGGGE